LAIFSDLAQRSDEVSYPLYLLTRYKNTENEHVALYIGGIVLEGVVFSTRDFKTPIHGSYYPFPNVPPEFNSQPLNENVKFSSRSEFIKEMDKLEKITMAPLKPIDKGGNCVDFLKKMLRSWWRIKL
jgi:hypothetical protein